MSGPAKALALDIVNTARRIGVLDNPVLTVAVAADARRAITTMRGLLNELEDEL